MIDQGKPWWEEAFGPYYDLVYKHRDEASARDEVAFVTEVINSATAYGPCVNGSVLDLACGAGRHLRELSTHYQTAVGLDYSQCLLREAYCIGSPPLVRGDMRHLPFDARSFDVVTQFFTAFGYFSNEEDDRQVLSEVERILRPGGWHMLDLPNPEHVAKTLVPLSERTVAEGVIREERWINCKRVNKTVTIVGRNSKIFGTWTESVRLYTLAELEEIYKAINLRIKGVFGEFKLSSLESSPRLIIFAEKLLR